MGKGLESVGKWVVAVFRFETLVRWGTPWDARVLQGLITSGSGEVGARPRFCPRALRRGAAISVGRKGRFAPLKVGTVSSS